MATTGDGKTPVPEAPSTEEGSGVTINVTVKTGTKGKLELKLNPCWTVAEVKKKVAEVSEVPEAQQRLIYRGKILKDAETLKSYDVAEGNTIHLVQSGGAKTTPPASLPGLPTPNVAGVTPAPSGSTEGASQGGTAPPQVSPSPNPADFLAQAMGALGGQPGGVPGVGAGAGMPPAFGDMLNRAMSSVPMNDLLSLASNPQFNEVIESVTRNPNFQQFMASAMGGAGAGAAGLPGGAGVPGVTPQGTAEATAGAGGQTSASRPLGPFGDPATLAAMQPLMQNMMQQFAQARGGAGVAPSPTPAGVTAPPPAAATLGGQPAAATAGGAGVPPPLQNILGGDPATLQALMNVAASPEVQAAIGRLDVQRLLGGAGGEAGVGGMNVPGAGRGGNAALLSQLLGGAGGFAPGAMGNTQQATNMTAAQLETQMKQLEDMGFIDKDANLMALNRHGGDVNAAIAWLLESGYGA